MSIKNFGTIDAQVQALLPNSSTDHATFRLFEVPKPRFDILDPKDTLMGYIKISSEEPVTYKSFLINNFPHLKITEKSYVIQRLLEIETTTTFHETFPRVSINSEPVLIDSDYIQDDQIFLAQICLNNFSDAFYNIYEKRIPDLVYEITVITPPTDEESLDFIYGTPLFAAMRPEDHEEFIDIAYFKQFIVPDFVMVKGSKGANGFDIAPRAIVDNAKDFDRDTLESAVRKEITLPACYSICIIFPKFFAQFGEFNHMPNQFILRSRVSKANVVLEYELVGGCDLKINLHNRNNFDLRMVEDPDLPNEIPMRCIQFVPSATLTQKIQTITDGDELARFMGVILVLNDKKRKSKV
jgi:hypothetical protein